MIPLRRAGIGALLAAFAALSVLVAAPATAATTYPALTGRVVDDAHVLAPEVQAELTGKLAALEQATNRQVVVATVASLQDQDIADYGVGLIRAWKIGDKATNSGAILIVAPAERKVRVEVGYGLEGVLTDALSERIIQTRILPKFRAGDISGGVSDGADALIGQLQLPDDQARANVAAAAAPQTQTRHVGRSPFGAIFGLLLVLWFVGGLFGRNRRYGGGGGGLGWLLPMIVLNGLGRGGGGWGGGGDDDGGGGGGFSGGGGSGGGGGASGSW